MGKGMDWRLYVDEYGDFELPEYLFRSINDLMKQALDMGVLLSEDQSKLRAYKENIKRVFKQRWLDIAKALEFFDIITPCGCYHDEYCDTCSGSRYKLNIAITPDKMREIGLVLGVGESAEIADQLHKGLIKALSEVDTLDFAGYSNVMDTAQ